MWVSMERLLDLQADTLCTLDKTILGRKGPEAKSVVFVCLMLREEY